MPPETAQPRPSRLLAAFNQPIAIFLLGTVIVGTGTSYLSEKRQCVAEWRGLQTAHQRLLRELGFRSDNLFANAANPALPRAERLEQTRLWLSPRAPSLYREFSGERYHSLFVRMLDLEDNLEIERNLDGVVLDYNEDRPAGRYGPMPFYDQIFERDHPPSEAERRGLATLLGLSYGSEEAILDMIEGPAGEAVRARLTFWLDALNNPDVVRQKGGCGAGAVFGRLWSPNLPV